MNEFFKDLLTDSSGDYSSRLISGWIAFFVMLIVIIVAVFIDKDVGETVTPLFIYVGACFGLSVFGELSRNKKKKITDSSTEKTSE